MFHALRRSGPFISACALALAPRLSANVGLPAKGFSDNMVLQRGMAAPVWGTADAGEDVTLTFRGADVSAKAGADGKWSAKVATGAAGGPFELSIKGKNALTLKNVMVGDVWIAGGQSNMEFTFRMLGGVNLDSARKAIFPDIRLMSWRGDGKWRPCDTTSVMDFSAVGYYFAKMIHQTQKIPIGVISSNVGGTEVERWMDPATLKEILPNDTDKMNGDLYRDWIAPLVPFGIKGAIWYQGESNAFNPGRNPHPTWIAPNYTKHFGAMIKGWRRVWNQGDFPFYYVQLANFMDPQTDPGEQSAWAEVREAQRLTLSLPNTHMAVIIDIGEAGDIHPKNKWDVGRRLALGARALAYSEKNLAYNGPLFRGKEVRGKTIRCVFAGAEGGLKPKEGDKVTGFAVSGADNKWVWADAVISKDTLVVSSAAVGTPVKVRYGWANNPLGNLYNGVGLPASPFQTDGAHLPVVLARVPDARAPGSHGPAALRVPGLESADALGRRFEALQSAPLLVPPWKRSQ
jgi:sialate O-acetylesterase